MNRYKVLIIFKDCFAVYQKRIKILLRTENNNIFGSDTKKTRENKGYRLILRREKESRVTTAREKNEIYL